jgi:hypothetical protein
LIRRPILDPRTIEKYITSRHFSRAIEKSRKSKELVPYYVAIAALRWRLTAPQSDH